MSVCTWVSHGLQFYEKSLYMVQKMITNSESKYKYVTKTYFKQTHSYDMVPLKVEEGQKKLIQHEVPPYNGYGTPEDSLGSVYSLQPKPPKKDMTKLFTNDQYVLRF